MRHTIRLALLYLILFGMCQPVVSHAGAASRQSASALVELQRSFTVDGKPVPPEIFRDFGDGNPVDGDGIWVTVDVRLATRSQQYGGDKITQERGGWLAQRKTVASTGETEEAAYRFVGTTTNGLIVVIAIYSWGGSGVFTTLHILDAALSGAFNNDGEVYDRLDLTNVRSVVLGDRWGGDVSIAGNEIAIITTSNGPTDTSGAIRRKTIEARRP